MLQQTRVAAVIPYYERFLRRFPTVSSLAEAPESDLLAHWAGLGYYYRARNLQKAAQAMDSLRSFPATYDAILTLPGIGEYTAAAIASIAFNLPYAVLDGNVFRVLSRLFADPTDIASNPGRKHFQALASSLLDDQNPGAFNQAMMELGATVCLPKAPLCLTCPVSQHCSARSQNRATDFPVKIVNKRSIKMDRCLYWIERDGNILVWQRPAESRLMPGFWELPEPEHLPQVTPGPEIGVFKHGITIHDYRFRLISASPQHSTSTCVWQPLAWLESAPLSTVFRKALKLIHKQPLPARGKTAVSTV